MGFSDPTIKVIVILRENMKQKALVHTTFKLNLILCTICKYLRKPLPY